MSEQTPEPRTPTAEHRHTSEFEKEQRIEQVLQWMADGLKGKALTAEIRQEFEVAESTAYEWVRRAHDRLREQAQLDTRSLVDLLTRRYLKKLHARKEATQRDAARDLRKMLGLDAPSKQHLTVESLDRYSEAELQALAQKAGLAPTDNPDSPSPR